MLAAEIRSQGSTLLEPHQIDFVLDEDIDHDYHAAGEPGSLLCVNLFKIYKESLTNVIKHAKATKVRVSLSIDGRGLRLAIEDNGVGCSAGGCNGRGLVNIRKRAAELGGVVTLSSGPGTRLGLEVPLPPQRTS
jgi:signal transduction histidine kinase